MPLRLVQCVKPIRSGAPDPGNNPGGHKVPGFNLRVLNCCLTLKFGVCIESLCPTSQNEKIKKKKSNFLKFFEIFLSSRKCSPFGQNSIC